MIAKRDISVLAQDGNTYDFKRGNVFHEVRGSGIYTILNPEGTNILLSISDIDLERYFDQSDKTVTIDIGDRSDRD